VVVRITPNDKNNPPGKLADAEVHFTEGELEGMKLIGFAVWERRTGGGRGRRRRSRAPGAPASVGAELSRGRGRRRLERGGARRPAPRRGLNARSRWIRPPSNPRSNGC